MIAPGDALVEAMREDIEPVLREMRRPLAESCPSELSFTNLLLFQGKRDWRLVRGVLPHLAGRSYDGTPQLIPLFALDAVEPARLHALQGAQGWFCPIANPVLDQLDRSRFLCRADRDDADYLYPADNFRHYARAGLGAKRAAVSALLERHRVTAVELQPVCREAARQVLQGWCHDKGCGPTDADVPSCATALSLASLPDGLFGYLHFVDDEPAGFVICEELNPGVVVVRFAKGLRRYDGIFPRMYQHLVDADGRRVDWVNFEQDLGHPNFRRSKQSFRPDRLLPKHRVRVTD